MTTFLPGMACISVYGKCRRYNKFFVFQDVRGAAGLNLLLLQTPNLNPLIIILFLIFDTPGFKPAPNLT